MMEMEVISLKQKNNEQARKLFYLENVSSTAFNRFSLTDAKFASASDKVFFVYNNLFYILTNSDISSQNPNSQVESRAVLSKSLDAYCPPNSHQVVVYGKEKIFDKTTNDRIEKPYIAVYDHTTDLIKCKFSHESNSKNPLYIKARASTIYNTINNNAADQMLSFISLVYSQEIFIYYGPFTNRKIDNPLKIDLNNHKIVLADFGKQIDIEGQLINTFLVVSSENGENKSKLTIWHLTKQNRITENAKFSFNFSFNYIFQKAVLLSLDTLCLFGQNENHEKFIELVNIPYSKTDKNSNDNTNTNTTNTNNNFILSGSQIMIPDEIQSFYSFGHFFCAITKNGKKDFLRVCDYKYVKDLFTTNSTPKKTTPIACVFSQEISENSKIMFDLLGKVYILNGTNVQILREEELLTVINELVETSKYFEYAKSLAQMANLNHEIAYIEWKQAISILNQNNLPNHDRMSKAMDHFIKTIGYKSPSDVIQYYIDTNDQELIRYLWGDNEGDEPSENSLIMQSLPGSTEYRRLLISICVMEYSDCKIKNEKMDKTELSECKPMKILHYLATHAEYSDCRDDLINAYLSMDLKEYAIELADKYQNYEQAIRIKFCQNIEKTKEYIIKLLRKNDISEERKMKILIEYVREILARSNNDISSNLGNINENNPTGFITNLIKEKNEAYINQICLIFLPQLDSDNKMSLLFYQFFKKVSENCKKLNLIIPRVMNDVYIQHMLQLVDENAPQIVDQLKQILAHSHYTIDVAILSILDLKSDKSSLDKLKIELFTTVFKSHPEYSSQLIHLFVTENETKKLLDLIQGKDDQKKSETQDHNQELQNPNETKIQGQNKFETQDENENLDSFLKNATPSLFIETIAEFMTILIRGNEENKAKNTDENNFENSPNSETKNISTTQKRNENTIPSLFLEAIAEFIRHENYVDLIPELLEASQKYVPLPDIINFLLNLPKEYFHKNTKLNVKMVRGYILDWMNKMMKKEADLKKQLEMNQQEFKKLRDPNSEKYTIEELKKIREDYNEQILRGSEMNRFEDKKKMSNIMVNKQRQSDDNFETSEWKRPFSTLKMEKQENFLAGSCLEEQFLKEIESGIFIDGIETKNPKDEHPYTNECKAMLKEFDEAFERVVHNQ